MTDQTPDPTLDGLLRSYGRLSANDLTDAANEKLAAIHAHVAQREAALREERDFAVAELRRVCDESGAPEPLAVAQHVRLQMATMEGAIAEMHTLRAEVERLTHLNGILDTTCAAHCEVLEQDTAEIARLEAEVERLREALDRVEYTTQELETQAIARAALASPPPATAETRCGSTKWGLRCQWAAGHDGWHNFDAEPHEKPATEEKPRE